MKVFVSGATGYIGVQLVRRLVKEGYEVHALYRSVNKTLPLKMKGVTLFKGDIQEPGSLDAAMKGCSQAYHVAAFASVWTPDQDQIYRLNVEGALHVVMTAKKAGLRRLVVTSTAGVLGPSSGDAVHEKSPVPNSFFTPYERSKYQMEQLLMNIDPNDIEVLVVNPTRVFGPGRMSESNGVTRMIRNYLKNNWRYVPGNGNQSGNYVYVEDVVTGHILAMERGLHGHRYILGGENLSYRQLFELVSDVSGVRKNLIGVPLWIMLPVAFVMKEAARITGRTPVIVPELVRKFSHQWKVSSEKAVQEIGYSPTPAAEAIAITVEWINAMDKA
ncbi:MAG: SDR family oxidoreductase [Bacteroidales bacterium]